MRQTRGGALSRSPACPRPRARPGYLASSRSAERYERVCIDETNATPPNRRQRSSRLVIRCSTRPSPRHLKSAAKALTRGAVLIDDSDSFGSSAQVLVTLEHAVRDGLAGAVTVSRAVASRRDAIRADRRTGASARRRLGALSRPAARSGADEREERGALARKTEWLTNDLSKQAPALRHRPTERRRICARRASAGMPKSIASRAEVKARLEP